MATATPVERAPQTSEQAQAQQTVQKTRQPKMSATGRLPVPAALSDVSPELADERASLLAEYAPDCVDKKDKTTGRYLPQSSDYVPFFADSKDPQRLRRMVKLGYEPVTVDGSQVDHRGDLLFKCPRPAFTARKARIGKRSSAQATDYVQATNDEVTKEGFYRDD